MISSSTHPISPLDGRYRSLAEPLAPVLCEAALNKARLHVEIEWILFLTSKEVFGLTQLTSEQTKHLRTRVEAFDEVTVARLAHFEAITHHDVKAVEYVVRELLNEAGLEHLAELTHFGATSEDINNLAYALTIRQAVETVWIPAFQDLLDRLYTFAKRYKTIPMLARTHGQAATPTTMGKECAVFGYRLHRVLSGIRESSYLGKFNGATGTFSAHMAADPTLDWVAWSKEFVSSLDLTWNPLTTQIESHDWQAELYSKISHANRIAHNVCTDMWTYISLGYFRQIPTEGATGSSTMPHKVNPIRFENAEANFELSCAVFDSLSSTLVTSRLQRDLTDSTTQRNVVVALGYSLVALKNVSAGLDRLELASDVLANELDANWEVLTEAIQTVIRSEILAGRSTHTDPYALIKNISRGVHLGAEELRDCIQTLDISKPAKERLLQLTPAQYVGRAAALVDLLVPLDRVDS